MYEDHRISRRDFPDHLGDGVFHLVKYRLRHFRGVINILFVRLFYEYSRGKNNGLAGVFSFFIELYATTLLALSRFKHVASRFGCHSLFLSIDPGTQLSPIWRWQFFCICYIIQ